MPDAAAVATTSPATAPAMRRPGDVSMPPTLSPVTAAIALSAALKATFSQIATSIPDRPRRQGRPGQQGRDLFRFGLRQQCEAAEADMALAVRGHPGRALEIGREIGDAHQHPVGREYAGKRFGIADAVLQREGEGAGRGQMRDRARGRRAVHGLGEQHHQIGRPGDVLRAGRGDGTRRSPLSSARVTPSRAAPPAEPRRHRPGSRAPPSASLAANRQPIAPAPTMMMSRISAPLQGISDDGREKGQGARLNYGDTIPNSLLPLMGRASAGRCRIRSPPCARHKATKASACRRTSAGVHARPVQRRAEPEALRAGREPAGHIVRRDPADREPRACRGGSTAASP